MTVATATEPALTVEQLVIDHLAADKLDLESERDTWREIALRCLELWHAERLESAQLRHRLHVRERATT